MKTNNNTSLLISSRFHSGISARRGLTLTEILAATFVLSFGLVAALTVLPFATFQLNRMNIADTSGACGRGAIQQIRMAVWQKPDMLHGSWPGWANGDVLADPYIVDPLGIIDPVADTPISTPANFPYNDSGGNLLYAFTLNDIVNFDAANRHFRWNDDMIFAAGTKSERPTLIERERKRPDGTTETEYVQQAAGDYTWLYMVTPVIDSQAVGFSRPPSGTNNAITIATVTPDEVLGYEVAAVVFHRRDTAPDPDDAYQPIRRIELNGTSVINATGAFIELKSSNPDELDLSMIKWVLLTSEQYLDRPLNAQWYRITGYDDIVPNGSNYERRVFLVGPDWKGAKNTTNGNPLGPVYAILCDGVVNVFQATMPK